MNDSMNTHGAGGRAGSNRMLVAEFEHGRAPGEFHHADHVRVAFAYVAEFPLLEAIGKFSAASPQPRTGNWLPGDTPRLAGRCDFESNFDNAPEENFRVAS